MITTTDKNLPEVPLEPIVSTHSETPVNPIVEWDFGDVKFDVILAETDADRQACYQLRYNSLVAAVHPRDVQMLPAEDYPDGLEHDHFDDVATMFLAREITDQGITPVGTFRLIPCDSKYGYYIRGSKFNDQTVRLPQFYKSEPVLASETLEASRLVGHPYTIDDGSQVLLSMLLMEAGRKFTMTTDRKNWICIITHNQADRLRLVGWTFATLYGGPAKYMNALREACFVNMYLDRFNFVRQTGPKTVQDTRSHN